VSRKTSAKSTKRSSKAKVGRKAGLPQTPAAIASKKRREQKKREVQELKNRIDDLENQLRQAKIEIRRTREEQSGKAPKSKVVERTVEKVVERVVFVPKDKGWKSEEDTVTRPSYDESKSYDYMSCIEAAAKYSSEVVIMEKAVEHSEPPTKRRHLEKSLFPQKSSTKKRFFQPSDDLISEIENVLEQYSEDDTNPSFLEELPVCLEDFVSTRMKRTPPRVQANHQRKYPTDSDVIEFYQLEAFRIDAINRILVKLHEIDKPIIQALLERIDLSVLDAVPKSDDERHEIDSKVDGIRLLDGIRQNHAVRKDLLAQITGIVIAARRRDNVGRLNIEEHHANACVAHDMTNERALLMHTRPTPGDGSGKAQVAKRSKGAPGGSGTN
jgi:hypothetical protein